MYNSGYHGTEQKTSAFWTAGLLLAARGQAVTWQGVAAKLLEPLG